MKCDSGHLLQTIMVWENLSLYREHVGSKFRIIEQKMIRDGVIGDEEVTVFDELIGSYPSASFPTPTVSRDDVRNFSAGKKSSLKKHSDSSVEETSKVDTPRGTYAVSIILEIAMLSFPLTLVFIFIVLWDL
eukprot:g2810.t1